MRFPRLVFSLLLALSLSGAFPAEAQEYFGKTIVEPSLVADTTAIAPGQPFTVGLLLKIAKDWHTYWRFGGDAGAPVTIEWQLPPGFTAGEIQWPIPHSRMDEGDLLSYVYEDEVMLLVKITPPAELPQGEAELRAHARWLVCEKTCIPGDGEVAVTLPTTGTPAPAKADLFARYRSLLPKGEGAPFQVKWERTGEAVTLHIEGLPKEFDAEFFPIPPSPEVTIGHPRVSAVAEDGARSITVPVEGASPNLRSQGVLVTSRGDAPREGWSIAAPAEDAAAEPQVAQIGTTSLISILWGAFLGGLILNLMPCVLPVIALKIFGFTQQAHQARERIFRLGLAFVAGVFVFFLGIAVLVIAVKAAGSSLNWGFQFQNPYLLTALIALVFVFALSFFGVFEVVLGSGAATQLDSLTRKEGYSGAFLHGAFTTLLGTSCTAPFLGPVLGFTFVQPPLIVFAVFLAIATGMSLPYFLLTWKPAWMRYLPKPGVWMERVKQFMGFVLLGVVVWLLGVLGQSRGVDAMLAVTCFLLALGLASWLFGSFRRSPVAWVAIVVVVVGSWFTFLQDTLSAREQTQERIAWENFSPARLSDALATGQPVFIDFTADWCLNCKYNERFVLETDPVRAALRENNVIPIKADWTNADPEITALLKKFGRVGVPVYVLYPGGKQEPIVLPEILTQALLLKHLNSLDS